MKSISESGTQFLSGGDEFLTITEVCTLLKIKRATVWRWRQDGLRCVCRGSLVRILKSDLNEFLGRHCK